MTLLSFEWPVGFEKTTRKILISNLMFKECSDRKFYKIEIIGHPPNIRRIKFECQGRFEDQKGQKREIV